ncbi:tetratricopeptide repeat protein [Magnetococcus sp. PR-3]|uniref:tetratricopeptide repeat protein n=1 Tax=Magnetococcus sp. PR-3 TaxID=3120355 RepID=UPI002FCE1B21
MALVLMLGMGSAWAQENPIPDLPEPVEPYLQAAEGGDLKAQYKLGEIYIRGRKTEHVESAAQWYLKAAENGHVEAMAKLGVMYYAGMGVSEDNTLAFKWLQKAALKNSADAQYHLGFLYEKGIGTTASTSRAVKWYDYAEAQRHRLAGKRKAALVKDMDPAEVKSVLAKNATVRQQLVATAQQRAKQRSSKAVKKGPAEVQALNQLMAQLKTNPDDEQTLSKAAKLNTKLGRHVRAAALYRDAVLVALKDKKRVAALKRMGGYNAGITQALSSLPQSAQKAIKKASRLPRGVKAKAMTSWLKQYKKIETTLGEGKTAQAKAQAQGLLKNANKKFGKKHLITLRSQALLAQTLLLAGKVEKAQTLYKEADTIGTEVLGAGHPEVLSYQTVLADALAAKGSFIEAAKQYERITLRAQQQMGDGHLAALNPARSQATMLSNAGQYNEAVGLFRALCTRFDANFGVHHPQSARCSNQMAFTLSEKGDLKAAEAQYQLALKHQAAASGLDNPELLKTSIALADIQRRMGNYKLAKLRLNPMIKLTGRKASLRIAHFQAKNTMALTLRDMGDYLEAEKLLREVVAFEAKTLGETHANTIASRTELAGLMRLQSRLAEAEVLYDEALVASQKGLGKTHPTTVAILNNLGLVYETQGLYDRAEPLFREALDTSRATLGETHPTTLAATNSLALLYEVQGNFEKAEPLYATAITANRKSLGDDHADTIAFINNLGYLYMKSERYDDAAELLTEVTESWRKSLGVRHQRTLKSINNLGRVRTAQKKYKEAEKLLQEAWDGRREALGETHVDTQRSMLDMGVLMLKTGRSIPAEKLLKKTLKLNEKTLGPQHPYTFETLDALARILETNFQLPQAYEIRYTAFQRRTEFLNRMMWVTSDNAREGYVRLHRPELNRFMMLLPHVNKQLAGRGVMEVGLQRKGMLFKITSEIHQIARLSDDPALRSIADELKAGRKKLAAKTLSGPAEDQTPEQHLHTMNALEERISTLDGELGRASLKFKQNKRAISLKDLEKALPEGAAMVDFVAYKDHKDVSRLLAGVMVKEDGNVQYELVKYEPTMKELEKQVINLRGSIQDEDMDEDDLLDLSMEIYDMVWGPVSELLAEKETVYVVPDGILNILPFVAMVDSEEEIYLLEKADLHMLTSSRDLMPSLLAAAKGPQLTLAGPNYDTEEVTGTQVLAAVRGRRSANRAAVMVSKEEAKGGTRATRAATMRAGLRALSRGMRGLRFDPLPGAEKEGQLITNTIATEGGKSNLKLQNEAQEEVVKDIEVPPNVLHIATHGFFLKADEGLRKRLKSMARSVELNTTPPPGDNPMLRSGLAFAGVNANAPFLGEIDTKNDGILTALEVLDLNLTGTQLAVLSACETGLGEIHEGEGVYGLRRAFQEAGAQEVIASLWEVSDAGTQALMTGLYKRLGEGMTPHQALRDSQIELMKSGQWGYPYIWSAFMSIGR